MTQEKNDGVRVLGIFPTTRGFGYAVFEGPGMPIDWGVRYSGAHQAQERRRKLEALLEWFVPDVIVVEDLRSKRARRIHSKKERLRGVARVVHARGHVLMQYSRVEIRRCFARYGARTKHEIAQVIANEFPELRDRVPPRRRPWHCENPRMAIFDATALVLTHYFLPGSPGAEP